MPGFNINGTGGDPNSKREVLRNYRWSIDITGPVILDRAYRELILDATIPSIEFEELLVEGMSLEYKIPKKPKFANIDVTFYDIGGLQKGFEDWVKKVWNPTQGLFEGEAPSNLKGTITLSLLDRNGNANREYKVYGAYPRRISHSKADMANDSLKTLIVEFSCDYYVMEKDQQDSPDSPDLQGDFNNQSNYA